MWTAFASSFVLSEKEKVPHIPMLDRYALDLPKMCYYLTTKSYVALQLLTIAYIVLKKANQGL